MPEPTKRTYGGPWLGYVSSVQPHMAPLNKATSDGVSVSRRSQNYRLDPIQGRFFRRDGMSVDAGSSGVLENGTGELTVARARQLLPLRLSSADGYQTYGVLFTEEGNNKGCVYFRSPNGGGADHVLGQEFGTTQHPTGIGTFYAITQPYVRTTDNTVGRFNTLALRAQAAAGSRRMAAFNDWLYCPNLTGTPWRWNQKYNEDNADTGDRWRVAHTGRPAPLGLPTVTTGTLNSAGSWHEGDKFYISVAYRFADGSVSMPIIPRDKSDEVDYVANSNHSGFGKISLARSGATPWDNKYLYLSYSNIPIGPEGVVGRYILRTPKLQGLGNATSTSTSGTEPSPMDLRVAGYIPNNTQTTYQDFNGNDLALVDDPLIVRFDHIMQPPARYIGTVDGRVMVGYTNPHPAAIYIAPDVNVADTATTIDDTQYEYTLTGGTLTLYKGAGTTTITNIGTKTVQQVVDLINNTVSGGSGGKWWAVHAPGADLQATCDNAGTAAANANLVSVTAGTETGDTSGRIRAFGPCWSAPIFFSSTYLGQFKTEKRRLFFTMGGPGQPSTAADSWSAANFRTAPESYGDLMGFGALPNGAIACFSRGIMVLQNRKAGISGEDADYRLYDLNTSRGCVAWDSIAEFNGAVGYLTRDGYVVTDGRDEVVISGDVWKESTQLGEWAYEIGQSAKAAAADSDLSHFHAKVMSGRLYLSFRLTASSSFPAHWLVYDFSGSSQYSGLRGVLQQDGSPWGWSTPLTCPRALGPMGEVVTTSGLARFAVDDTDSTTAGQNSCGRIYNMETGNSDPGPTGISAALWTCRDMAGSMKRKAPQEARVLYKRASTGMALAGYVDGSGTSSVAAVTLPATAGAFYSVKVVPFDHTMRSPARQVEFKFSEADTNAGGDIYGAEVDMVAVDSYT